MKRYIPLISIGLLVLGGCAAWLIVTTAPEAKRVPPPVSSPFVVVTSMNKGIAHINVNALGTVKAAQETRVCVQVSGQVEELGANFEAGKILQKGDLMVQLDTKDYENALASAKADYDLELGQQRVARSELAQLNKIMPSSAQNTALALRKPHLAKAEANLHQAQLSLERTRIVSPYNAFVVERQVSLGSYANATSSVAHLVGTDEYRIEAAIPLDRLHTLGMKVLDGAVVKIHSATNTIREGIVLHTIANIDTSTRMGRVLISVPDPLGLANNAPALLLGDSVRIELQAGTLNDVIALPRNALRDNDTVWIAQANEGEAYTLDIRTVTVAWKGTEEVIISDGLKHGERVITSPLGAAVQGMPIRIYEQTSAAHLPTKNTPQAM